MSSQRSSRLLKLLTIVTLAGVSTAFPSPADASAAAPTCAQVLTQAASGPIQFDAMMHQLMEPQGEEPLGEIISSRIPLTHIFDRFVTRANSAYEPPAALKDILPEPWDEKFDHESAVATEDFYRKVYGRYETTFNEQLIQTLIKVDKSVDMSRSDYGVIRSRKEIVGTWRWFHASPYHYGMRTAEPYKELPFMLINRARKVRPRRLRGHSLGARLAV